MGETQSAMAVDIRTCYWIINSKAWNWYRIAANMKPLPVGIKELIPPSMTSDIRALIETTMTSDIRATIETTMEVTITPGE